MTKTEPKVMTNQSMQEFLQDCPLWQVTFLTGNSERPGTTVYANSLIANAVEYLDGDTIEGETLSGAIIFSRKEGDQTLAEVILVVNNLQEVHRDDTALVCMYPYLVVTVNETEKYPYIVISKNINSEGVI